MVDALAGLCHDTARPLARGVLKLLDTPIPEGTTDQHDWGLKQYQGAKMLTRLLWPHLAASEKDEVLRKFRSMLVQSYSLYRPDDGMLPGTLERERLWGSASEATLTPVHARIERWEQATLPRISEARSFRIYQDLLPSAGTFDSPELLANTPRPSAFACSLTILPRRQSRRSSLPTAGVRLMTSQKAPTWCNV